MDRLDPLYAELDRSARALRAQAERFSANITEAMLRVDEEPTPEHRARRLDYLMALHYVAKKAFALSEHDEEAAERWQSISDRYMDKAYGIDGRPCRDSDDPGPGAKRPLFGGDQDPGQSAGPEIPWPSQPS